MGTLMCCGECGIEFSVPDHFYRKRRETRKSWSCPNGHERHFCESESDKLRRERDRLAQQIAQRDDEIKAKDRQIKKMKKREAAGTCPCCQRTFSNMAEHIKGQHPEFVADSGATVIPIKRAERSAPRASRSNAGGSTLISARLTKRQPSKYRRRP